MLNPEFQTHLLNDEGIKKAVHIGNVFDALLQDLKLAIPEGRYLSIVSTKLEEACFFAKKAMAVQPENQKEGFSKE